MCAVDRQGNRKYLIEQLQYELNDKSKKLQQIIEAISKTPERNLPDIINLYYQAVMVQTLAKKLKKDFEPFTTSENKKLLDFSAGVAVNSLGYNHSVVKKTIQEQLKNS